MDDAVGGYEEGIDKFKKHYEVTKHNYKKHQFYFVAIKILKLVHTSPYSDFAQK